MNKHEERIHVYLQKAAKQYKTGIAREHAYRGYLQTLIEELAPEVLATNEPARIECGAPDYIITKNNIPLGYIEAKDVGKPLESKEFKEQFERYKSSLDNLIITDYLNFWLYRDGVLVSKTQIGIIASGGIEALSDGFVDFANVIAEFTTYTGQTITSASKLSKMMAGKARLLAKVIETALTSDEECEDDSTLRQQMEAFRNILIHDITSSGFADIYAQTIAYGMFAARLHDEGLDNFSRQEAAELIPKSNPFLRNLFGYIAGPNLDDRIRWIVDALADIFRATDVATLLKSFGRTTRKTDPLIHFYETFLAEYDPKLRKSKGVWYTPEPVVMFIVRAVDNILKDDFGLEQGLGDSSKIVAKRDSQVPDKRWKTGIRRMNVETHKVQILDPAVGTGTFLAEITRNIHRTFRGQEGVWGEYVDEHLIPRLNGFELLMASYSMAHLKMDLILSETGHRPKKDQRFRIFLTNSLEEHHPDTGTLFASWLSKEASEANHIKRDTPVMVVLGNPPYSKNSSNKGDWILELVADYKKDLNERSINALSDDYVKFIRYGQYLVDKNGKGVLAFISNNSFLDGVTHRIMRKSLLNTFDKIYILNLHGDSNKGEICPDGSPDNNVFDIKQGVAISIYVKTGSKSANKSAKLTYLDLYGSRKFKYATLSDKSIADLQFSKIETPSPYYWFVPKSYASEDKYREGFGVNEIFLKYGTGIKFRKDNLLIRDHDSPESVRCMVEDMASLDANTLMNKYSFQQTKDFVIDEQRTNFADCSMEDIHAVQYRPFDLKYTYYPLNKISKIIPRGDSRKGLMQNMIFGENYALLTARQNKSINIDSFFITNHMSEMKCAERTIQSYHFPLYIYSEDRDQDSLPDKNARESNLSEKIILLLSQRLDLTFVKEEGTHNTFAPLHILDYIYAIIYTPKYREAYKEYLKVDFPRIPFPDNKSSFWRLVAKGRELRESHLLKDSLVQDFITTYPQKGDNTITRKIVDNDFETKQSTENVGRIWINDKQYFDGVPKLVWELGIGGYQPARKWLKDRVGRKLSFGEIQHYQKVVLALNRTIKIMDDLDKITVL